MTSIVIYAIIIDIENKQLASMATFNEEQKNGGDSLDKLLAIAYYMGREEATREGRITRPAQAGLLLKGSEIMKNFVGLKAEIKKQKAIRARLDNERGRQTVNWKAATFRLALLNHWKRQGVGLPDNYRQLWNPPTNWTARTLKERTPLHVWEVDALRAGLVAEACKKFKNATSPLIRWMIRDELAAKVTELYRRPVF